MCLIIDRTLHKKDLEGYECIMPFVADRDILVTKMLMPSKKNWLFGRRITKTPIRYHEIKFGYDGTATLEDEFSFDLYYNKDYDTITHFVEHGIHAYTGVGQDSSLEISSMYFCVEHKAIIPKGTNYYLGKKGDIVAEKMTIFFDDKAYNRYTERNGVPKRVTL